MKEENKEESFKDVVSNAKAFYINLCEKQKILDVSASDDVAPGVKLTHLIDSQGWLPFIMIKSDEICKMLTGQKMWDAYYISDPMALRGLSVVNYDSLNTEQKEIFVKNKFSALEIPNAAKSMIALSGLKKAVNFKNDQCYLQNLQKAYFVNGLIAEGEALPELPVELFFSIEMNNQIIRSLNAINQIMVNSIPEPEVSR